jgi:putative glutamine amidotransferase
VPRILVAYLREDKIGPYVEALAAAGLERGQIVRTTPALAADADLEALVDGVDGLLLTGGADVETRLYGEAPIPEANLDPPVPERDRLEHELLERARRRELPVFAICRGHQMVNVFLGGSLFQDLALQAGLVGHDRFVDAGFAPDHRAHEVAATGADHAFARRLREIGDPLPVNSRHHQGVRRLGTGMVVAARAPDGAIEATALDDPAWWVRSVQWHPENLIADPAQLALFADFLVAARRHAETRPVEVAR